MVIFFFFAGNRNTGLFDREGFSSIHLLSTSVICLHDWATHVLQWWIKKKQIEIEILNFGKLKKRPYAGIYASHRSPAFGYLHLSSNKNLSFVCLCYFSLSPSPFFLCCSLSVYVLPIVYGSNMCGVSMSIQSSFFSFSLFSPFFVGPVGRWFSYPLELFFFLFVVAPSLEWIPKIVYLSLIQLCFLSVDLRVNQTFRLFIILT